MNKTEVSGQRKSFKSRTYVAVKNDISIVFCTDLSVKESIKSTIGNWSKKGLLKNFIFIESYENNQFLASECINGQYIEILDLKRKLSGIELNLIRTVALTFPDKTYRYPEFYKLFKSPYQHRIYIFKYNYSKNCLA